MDKINNALESRGTRIALVIFSTLATVIWAVVDCLDVLGIREMGGVEGCDGLWQKEEVHS